MHAPHHIIMQASRVMGSLVLPRHMKENIPKFSNTSKLYGFSDTTCKLQRNAGHSVVHMKSRAIENAGKFAVVFSAYMALKKIYRIGYMWGEEAYCGQILNVQACQ